MIMPSRHRIAEAMGERGVGVEELAARAGLTAARVAALSGRGGATGFKEIPTAGEARAIALALGDGLSCRFTLDGWAEGLVAWLEEAQAAFGADDYCHLAYFEAGDCTVAFMAADEPEDEPFESTVRALGPMVGAASQGMPIGDALGIARAQLDPCFEFPDGGRFVTPDLVGWDELARMGAEWNAGPEAAEERRQLCAWLASQGRR